MLILIHALHEASMHALLTVHAWSIAPEQASQRPPIIYVIEFVLLVRRLAST